MKIGFEGALGVHPQALSLRSMRTNILAQNVANSDTPGYQARDIDFAAELARRMEPTPSSRSSLQDTHPAHLQAQQGHAGLLTGLKYRMPLMPSFDGNTVDAQLEQSAFAENNLHFQASLRFLDGKFKGLLTAIKGE